jgi:hypothetical protein
MWNPATREARSQSRSRSHLFLFIGRRSPETHSLRQGTSTLVARSDDAFYMKEWDGEAEFHQDADGNWLLDIFTLPNETMLTLRKSPEKE